MLDVMDIKLNNKKRIIDIVRFNSEYTQKDIAYISKLSMATVNNICNELIEEGVLTERKIKYQGVGRKPSNIIFNYHDFHVLAIDLQIESILDMAILNFRNEILVSSTIHMEDAKKIEDIIIYIENTYQSLQKQLNLEINLIGVGVSVPAIFDHDDERLKGSALSIFENVPLKKMLNNIFDCKVYIDNCARLRAVSVQTEDTTCNNIVCIDISQGVGLGVISEGNVIRGKNGYGTEIAHIPIGSHLRCPKCGSFGCVETDLAIDGIIKKIQPDQNLEFPENWINCVTKLYQNQLQYADYLRFLGTLLGKLTSILINLFDPEKLYITGYFVDIMPLIEQSFYKELNTRSFYYKRQDITINTKKHTHNDIFITIGNMMYNLWVP